MSDRKTGFNSSKLENRIAIESALQTRAGEIRFLLKRSCRRRTISIVIHPTGTVDIFAPQFARDRDVFSFIEKKAEWIRKHLQRIEKHKNIIAEKQFKDGGQFLFLGKKCGLRVSESGAHSSRIVFDGQRWQVDISSGLALKERESRVREMLVEWYREQAEEVLGGRVFHYGRIMGVEPQTIAVRAQKRLWGSCHFHQRKIHLNWQIVLAPMDVIDYVVVHELAHLFHPNHSKRFWNKVATILPDCQRRKKWLKEHAAEMLL